MAVYQQVEDLLNIGALLRFSHFV
ncbi:MAG: hypothetical protein HY072_08290 [Deltaproteobacteria bacterium]|nr:hypothetical protein [Deltaproteobacteria bacterium]